MENEIEENRNETPALEMAPHTKAKHVILKNYLLAWFPIMYKFNRKLDI